MPIVHEVVAVLDGVKDPRRAVGELMGRAFRSENDRPAPEGV
jgi:glycerol-3-phosphate dehydrogenase